MNEDYQPSDLPSDSKLVIEPKCVMGQLVTQVVEADDLRLTPFRVVDPTFRTVNDGVRVCLRFGTRPRLLASFFYN